MTTDAARDRGLDVRAGAAGLVLGARTEALGDPDGRVLAAHIVKLWEFLPLALDDECFGVSLATLAAGAARASFGPGEPEPLLLAGGHRVHHAIPGVAR